MSTLRYLLRPGQRLVPFSSLTSHRRSPCWMVLILVLAAVMETDVLSTQSPHTCLKALALIGPSLRKVSFNCVCITCCSIFGHARFSQLKW